jgi:hypothetical protein
MDKKKYNKNYIYFLIILSIIVLFLTCVALFRKKYKSIKLMDQHDPQYGCSQEWSYNYNNSSHDDNTCINSNTLLNLLNISSNQKKCTVIINDGIVLQNNKRAINVITLNKDRNLKVDKIISVDPINRSGLIDLLNHLESITNKYIIIVSSGQEPFIQFDNYVEKDVVNKLIYQFKLIGARSDKFYRDTNYILIGSKDKDDGLDDIYFETKSEDDVYFPDIKITNKMCKMNTASFYPPKEYRFYNDFGSNEDRIKKCGLEASRKGFRAFGIVDDSCITFSDNKLKQFKKVNDSEECLEGLGSFRGVSGYEFDKMTNTQEMFKKSWKVKIYSDRDFKGTSTIIDEGTHDLTYNFIIKSIKIPSGINVTFYSKKNGQNLFLYGPIETNVTTDLIFNKLTVESEFDKNVSFCNSIDGNKECYIKGPGKHAVDTNKYWKIKYVNVSPVVNSVSLYQDSNYLDKLHVFGPGVHVIDYPRIIRSVGIN